MESFEAYRKLIAAGYTVTEAHHILRYAREEQECPSSRKKTSRVSRAEAALREVGVMPHEIDFIDAGQAWKN